MEGDGGGGLLIACIRSRLLRKKLILTERQFLLIFICVNLLSLLAPFLSLGN